MWRLCLCSQLLRVVMMEEVTCLCLHCLTLTQVLHRRRETEAIAYALAHTHRVRHSWFIYLFLQDVRNMWVGPSNVVSHDTPHTSKCASFFIACLLVMCGFHCTYVVSREETCWPDLLYYNLYNVCIVSVSVSVVSVCIFGAFCLCV